jgi:hypothetical protein
MMSASSAVRPDVECHPITPTHWPDLEPLFGPRGATGGLSSAKPCVAKVWR